MATFLQLCQEVARESGTISGNEPTTTVGQTGRLAKIVSFTRDAWRDIQLARPSWNFMTREFSGSTIAGTTAYTPAAWNLNDLAAWQTAKPIYCYPPPGSATPRWTLELVPWEAFRDRYDPDAGSDDAGQPLAYTIRPYDNAMLLGPTPAGAYRLRGIYRKMPQELVADGDVPAMPTQHHAVIRYRALVLLAGHDEASGALQVAGSNFIAAYSDLVRDQTPQIELDPGAIA